MKREATTSTSTLTQVKSLGLCALSSCAIVTLVMGVSNILLLG